MLESWAAVRSSPLDNVRNQNCTNCYQSSSSGGNSPLSMRATSMEEVQRSPHVRISVKRRTHSRERQDPREERTLDQIRDA